MLSYFANKEALPEDWRNLPSKAKEAYWALMELKERRLEYINSHSKKNDFRSDKYYLISSKSELAQIIGVSPQALSTTNSVSYADKIDLLIKEINKELLDKVHEKFSKPKVTSKSLKKENSVAVEKVKDLQKNNVKEQVSEIISRLHLPVRNKLFMK